MSCDDRVKPHGLIAPVQLNAFGVGAMGGRGGGGAGMSRCKYVLLPAQRTLHRAAYPKHAPPARHPSGVTGDPTTPAIPLARARVGRRQRGLRHWVWPWRRDAGGGYGGGGRVRRGPRARRADWTTSCRRPRCCGHLHWPGGG